MAGAATAAMASRIFLLAVIAGFVLYALPTATVGRYPIAGRRYSKEQRVEATAEEVRACMNESVTVRMRGRFGNVFMEYASAWAVARAHGLQVALPAALRDTLSTVFEQVPEPTISEFLKDRKTPDGSPCLQRIRSEELVLENITDRDDIAEVARAGGPVVLAQYSVLIPYVAPLEEELRAHARFRPYLRERSRISLSKMGAATAREVGVEPHEVLFVGVHVRRTDYPSWLRRRAGTNRTAEEGYFARALSLLEEELARENDGSPPPLAAVIASDDMRWVHAVLVPKLRRSAGRRTRVFAAGGPKLEVDLALLAACNHTIIAYGTFGLTAALLSGGRSIAFRLHSSYTTSQLARALPNWELLE